MARILLAVMALMLAGSVQKAAVPIVLDGQFDDWEGIAAAVVDPKDAPGGVVDFGEVRTFADGRFVYLMFDAGRTISLQSMSSGTVSIVVDYDGNSETGETVYGLDGADLVVDATPPSGNGVFIRRLGPAQPGRPPRQPSSAIGFRYSPRYASDRFECRFDRGDAAALTLKLVFVRDGQVGDETAPIRIVLPPLAAAPGSAPESAEDPLARAPGTAFRVMAWNASGPTPYDADAVNRLLEAINPDVVMLDEIRPIWTLDGLRRRFTLLGRASWNVAMSQGGGNERTVVALRGDLNEVFGKVPYPTAAIEAYEARSAPMDRWQSEVDDDGVSAGGFLATVDGRRLLVVSLDLTCCGDPTSGAEAWRMAEVEAIRAATAQATRTHSIDGVIVAGDFNLVGARAPVTLMRRGLDLDGSDLEIVDALELDGGSKDTWRSPGGFGAFPPGRLDWMLLSGSSMDVRRAFVFDTAAIGAKWLAHHGLRRDDSERTSDHLPIVADLAWRKTVTQ